ncbi:hypothetical protein DFH09DRAFT_1080097 [Mycena vulgaris]|nr:hypothetical protein DFH09DRAFT_1080097 [Mycena vulgaris]
MVQRHLAQRAWSGGAGARYEATPLRTYNSEMRCGVGLAWPLRSAADGACLCDARAAQYSSREALDCIGSNGALDAQRTAARFTHLNPAQASPGRGVQGGRESQRAGGRGKRVPVLPSAHRSAHAWGVSREGEPGGMVLAGRSTRDLRRDSVLAQRSGHELWARGTCSGCTGRGNARGTTCTGAVTLILRLRVCAAYAAVPALGHESPVVLARSGSGIGSNLNWTEPNAAFRFGVHRMAEPNARFMFGVRALRPAFEPGANAEPESHKRLTHTYVGLQITIWMLLDQI